MTKALQTIPEDSAVEYNNSPTSPRPKKMKDVYKKVPQHQQHNVH